MSFLFAQLLALSVIPPLNKWERETNCITTTLGAEVKTQKVGEINEYRSKM